MGCSSSSPVDLAAKQAGKNASKDVDLQLVEQQIQELFKFKILLLGAGESGKSTVVKQVKLLHKKKIGRKELELVGTSLHQNVVDCFKSIFQAMRVFGLQIEDEEDRKTEAMLLAHDESKRLTPEDAERLHRLFQNPAVQAAYARRQEFWLLDSFPYCMENLRRFCEDNFVPTEEDSVMARIRTTGIVVTNLESKIQKVDKDEPDMLQFQVVDVGGQRNERKKWIHCFDDVSAILFIVNLAGYDQVMFEDNTRNRMVEELELFNQVVSNPLFEKTPIFVFLNKKDLFETNIKERDMKHVFIDYTGGTHLEPALTYIQDAFRKQCPPGKSVQLEIVTARYKRDIKYAFDGVKKLLYERNRKERLQQLHKLRQQQKQIWAQKLKEQQACFGCCGNSTAAMPLVPPDNKYADGNEEGRVLDGEDDD